MKKTIEIDEDLLNQLREAMYDAYDEGKFSEQDLNDMAFSLRGVYRNPKCEGRAFHSNVSHVC